MKCLHCGKILAKFAEFADHMEKAHNDPGPRRKLEALRCAPKQVLTETGDSKKGY